MNPPAIVRFALLLLVTATNAPANDAATNQCAEAGDTHPPIHHSSLEGKWNYGIGQCCKSNKQADHEYGVANFSRFRG